MACRSAALTKAQMLLDISPLCLYHNVPMMIAQAERDPERILDPIYYWYACSVRGCHLRYDTGRGYHGTTDDELDPSATNKAPCYECSHRLYMSKLVKPIKVRCSRPANELGIHQLLTSAVPSRPLPGSRSAGIASHHAKRSPSRRATFPRLHFLVWQSAQSVINAS
jgi:hypothetical protein